MSQKEQIKSIVHSFDIGSSSINETVDKLAQNQDEFSIGFAYWLDTIRSDDKVLFFTSSHSHLLEIYKDQL